MRRLIHGMQTYYARRAPYYDRSMGYDDTRTVERLAPVIESIRDLLRDRDVLEIACGPCFWTQQLVPAVRSILATDYNESMLAEARRKPLDRSKVTLQIADAYRLPPFSRTFDGCLAVDWLAHVPRTRFHEFLRGVHRKLTRNSAVVFCDQTSGPSSITELRDAEGNHLQERSLSDGSCFPVIKHFLTDDEIESVFAPYTTRIMIRKFAACRRVVVSYRLDRPNE